MSSKARTLTAVLMLVGPSLASCGPPGAATSRAPAPESSPAASSGRAEPARPATPPERWCVGPACLGMTEQELVQVAGSAKPDAPDWVFQRCYVDRATSRYLGVVVSDEDPAHPVMAVTAALEPTCPSAVPLSLPERLTTCLGIALGDPVEALASMGSKARPSELMRYPWNRPEPGLSQVDYDCEPGKDCSVQSSVLVKDGRIVGISLWSPDC